MKISEQNLIKYQAYSGLVFAVFLVLHLSNTMLALFGQSSYDELQVYLRLYYQILTVEVFLLSGGLLLHITISIWRIIRRRRRQAGKSVRPASLRLRLHRYSGYYLLLVTGGHVFATRSPQVMDNVPVDFSFLTFSLTYWPWFFYPYYILFVTCGIFHLCNGLVYALKTSGFKIPAALTGEGNLAFWLPVSLFIAAGITAVLSFGGLFYDVDTTRFADYQSLYESYLPAWALPW